MIEIEFTNVAPMTSVQDAGRPGMLRHGVAASGPMDHSAYLRAGALLGNSAATCIEFGAGRVAFRVTGGPVRAAFCGGDFDLRIFSAAQGWESAVDLADGDEVVISPGSWGNWGLLRFDREIDVPHVLCSRATNLIAGLGGYAGRCLRIGDKVRFAENGAEHTAPPPHESVQPSGPTIRVIWGIHADLFSGQTREALLTQPFVVSSKLDRMGIQLTDKFGVFSSQTHLSLVSDVVVPGDIQILGDGTPVVLMRDHQPSGGYPRIATVIGPDIDRLAQMRPGSEVRFASVTVDRAQSVLRSGGPA